MQKQFKKWDVDWVQLLSLLRVSLINEWRPQQGSSQKKKRRIPVLVRSLLFYLIMGFSLGASLVARVPPSLYTLFCYSYFMMMAGFAVILECSQTLMVPDDLDILSHRPVSSTTLFLARLAHMLIFILIFSATLCIGPTIVTLFLENSPATFPLSFFGVALLAVIFIAALMMLLYTALLRWVRFEKMKSMVMVVQFLFTMVLIFIYQLIARSGWENATITFQLNDSWLRWLPPGWFTAMVESIYGPTSFEMLVLSIFAIGMSVWVLIVGFQRLSLNYLYDVAQHEMAAPNKQTQKSSTKKSSFKKSIFSASLIRNPETRAGFFLAFQLLRRDRSVKMTLLPMLAMPVVILIWGIIEGDILDPFYMSVFGGGANSMQLLPFFIAFLIFMTVKGSVYIRDWEARWIFQSTPIVSPLRFWRGARAGLFAGAVCPFYILLLIIFSSQFSFLHAIQHTLYLLLLGLLFMSIISIRHKELPFSKKRERGERIGGMAFFLFLIPFQIVAVFVHLFAYKNQVSWFISIASLFLLWILLEWWSNRQKNSKLMLFEALD